MSKQLPENPNLDHLRKQAKELLKSSPELKALSQAQYQLAKDYGFESWPKLVAAVEEIRAKQGVTDEIAAQYVLAALTGPYAGGTKAKRLFDLYPALPGHSIFTALVSGEIDLVREWSADKDVNAASGKLNLAPLEYVAYSRVHRADPSRKQALLDTANFLLDQGADPNGGHNKFGGDPLPILYGASCESRHLELTRLLLERGAKPNDGESIYHAAQFFFPEMLEVLAEFGADISMRDDHWGNTPLYFLAGHRPTDNGADIAMKGIRWLLEHGADPNVPCKSNKETPLQNLCARGWGRETVEMFLKHGADPNLKREDGRTAYALAISVGNIEAAETLEQAGADTNLSEEDQIAAAFGRGEAAPLPPASLVRDAYFVRLAEIGNVRAIRAMLEAGMPIDARGQDGATALHFAGFCRQAEVGTLLLENGADVKLRDSTYKATPLGWLLHSLGGNQHPTGDPIALIQALLAYGADRIEVDNMLAEEDAPEILRML